MVAKTIRNLERYRNLQRTKSNPEKTEQANKELELLDLSRDFYIGTGTFT